MKSLLVRSVLQGAHVRATFFMGNSGQTRANLGTIAFREDEFGPFCEALYMGAAWVDDLEVEIRAKGEESDG